MMTMKRSSILLALALVFAACINAWAIPAGKGATSLTGGTTSSLDNINGGELNDGDPAVVNLPAGGTYWYTLDEDSGLAENSPFVISPDTNAGNKRWICTNCGNSSQRGDVETATNTEAQAKSDNTLVLTAANLAALDATESLSGMVEKATTTESRSGTVGKYMDVDRHNYAHGGNQTSFRVIIRNNGGTLEHLICESGGNTGSSSSFASGVSGASTTYTTTPTGADASTAFATGVKIGSAATNRLYFNTLSIPTGELNIIASLVLNGCGTDLLVEPRADSININGVTRNYLAFSFRDRANNTFALTTVNIGAGTNIQVVVTGYLP